MDKDDCACKGKTLSKHIRPAVLAFLATGVGPCQPERLTSAEAREALDEAALSNQALSLISGTVEITTNFTIGQAGVSTALTVAPVRFTKISRLEKLDSPSKVVEGFGGKGKIMYEDNTGYANMNINERKGFCFSQHDKNGEEIKVYFDDNVLYKDLSGIKGHCLYGTVSKGKRIRFSFIDNKVIAIYEYRTEPLEAIENTENKT